MSDQKVVQKAVSRDDVLKMAALSRLQPTEDEQALFARQFQDILGYMDILASVDTEGVEPLYSVAMHGGLLRDDAAEAGLDREDALSNAPLRNDGCFVVPRIV
ncbi:MAG: Asp-tRNA(Asn)/Glu-tRNA(Gln) amidotransferase subunit GatC [Desulfovibrio sp.]|jgi:aspartyl-tRNA(Asn)/glutamyl-tRNA(Gln) amidotransferase subunit C|nr:Asp-tRNA(Asn)/Glu-tRNA(Gln) amidotransferase subunit GatC [Desulfovibrio sp.]